MYDSRAIANRLLQLAHAAGQPLTPMQVLKLVYICHGWMLGLYDRRLIRDEVQAWRWGPVIPQLYNAMRNYKNQPVTAPIAAAGVDISRQASNLIRDVFEEYGHLEGMTLSRLTHAPGTPWAETYKPGAFGTVIPTKLIRDHYAELAAEAS